MREISLACGLTTQVSDEDFLWLVGFNWHRVSAGPYAARKVQRNGRKFRLLMHVEIAKKMGLDTSFDIDHVDRNSLNNQRYNLRAVTHQVNILNSKLNTRNTTGFRGVCKRGSRYTAELHLDGRSTYFGAFDSAEEASAEVEVQLSKFLERHVSDSIN